jgi:hypothetical protein
MPIGSTQPGLHLRLLPGGPPAGRVAWVPDNDVRTVLLRHLPRLRPTLRGVDDASARSRTGD